ncbi:hypothetical protein NQ315_011333 [Exocentrus adspersus]|uniref:DUF5641 domain-containing protein n=1 Tax=Exocentrus adspersus TaxID=1586481 RepID=A0AAV8VK33_9CUCU|nr:hypothetical protein NQ315_011333 [Exocentrus adspersus]
MAEKVKKVKILRDCEIGKLNDVLSSYDEAQTNAAAKSIFKARYQDINDIKSEFCKHNVILMNLVFQDEGELKDAVAISREFDAKFYKIKACFDDMFAADANSMLNSSASINAGAAGSGDKSAKLPKFDLIKFSGDITQFSTYIDYYNSSIHENESLSPISKFRYLISSLEGPPLKIVTRLPMTSSNYIIAYNALVKRYKNQKLLAQSYFSAIENLPKMTSKDPLALRNMLDVFLENLEALRTLEYPVDSWDFIMAHIATPAINNKPTHTNEFVQPSTSQTNLPSSVTSVTSCLTNSNTVVLATAVIEVVDVRGNFQKVRCLLDPGSQISFITSKCANQLGLPKQKLQTNIQGIGELNLSTQLGAVHLNIRPVGELDPKFSIYAVILPKICTTQPNVPLPASGWDHIKNLKLADPNFFKPGPLDVLIGADLYPYIIQGGQITGTAYEPVAINTVFGFILMGKIVSPTAAIDPNFKTLCSHIEQQSLNNILQKFWELENIPQCTSSSLEDIKCEQIFTNTVSRNSDGRFIVTLPFKNDILPTFPTEDTYVDDIVTGCSTVGEALALKNELIHLCNKGGFELHKWGSNKSQLLANSSVDARNNAPSLSLDTDEITKVLGLLWVPSSDTFTYKLIQRIQQDFWRRWHREYITTLQVRNNWLTSANSSPAIGTLVLIYEDNTTPLNWRLGRITMLYPGKDGISRVADVQTSTVREFDHLVPNRVIRGCPHGKRINLFGVTITAQDRHRKSSKKNDVYNTEQDNCNEEPGEDGVVEDITGSTKKDETAHILFAQSRRRL